jgi:hypothetical protein
LLLRAHTPCRVSRRHDWRPALAVLEERPPAPFAHDTVYMLFVEMARDVAALTVLPQIEDRASAVVSTPAKVCLDTLTRVMLMTAGTLAPLDLMQGPLTLERSPPHAPLFKRHPQLLSTAVRVAIPVLAAAVTALGECDTTSKSPVTDQITALITAACYTLQMTVFTGVLAISALATGGRMTAVSLHVAPRPQPHLTVLALPPTAESAALAQQCLRAVAFLAGAPDAVRAHGPAGEGVHAISTTAPSPPPPPSPSAATRSC